MILGIYDVLTGNVFLSYLGIGTLLAIIHLLISGIMYSLSKFFQDSKWIAISKTEIAHALYSFFIMGMVLVGIAMTNGVFCASLNLLGSSYGVGCAANLNFDTHIAIARAHLAAQYNNLRVLAIGMLRLYDWKATTANMDVGLGLLSVSPFSYQAYDAFAYKEMFSLLAKVMLFMKFQEIVMLIGGIYLFPLLLGLGIALRSLALTRKTGGLLIAIALGLFYFLPYSYILSMVVVQSNGCFSSKYIIDAQQVQITGLSLGNTILTNGQEMDTEKLLEKYSKDVENQLNIEDRIEKEIKAREIARAKLAKDMCTDPQYEHTDVTTGYVKDYVEPNSVGLTSHASVDQIMNSCKNIKPSPLQIIAFQIIATTFTAIISIVATISAIKELSPLFGGDTEIAGLTRMI